MNLGFRASGNNEIFLFREIVAKKLSLCLALTLSIFVLSGCPGGGGSSSQSLTGGSLGVGLQKVSGDSQVTTPGASWAQPIVVRVATNGVAVPQVPVSFTDSTSRATVVNPVVLTDNNGYARTSAVAPSASNVTITISATIPDGSKVDFELQTRSFPDTPTMTLQDPVTMSLSYAMQPVVSINIVPVTTAVKWCVSETQVSRPPDGTVPCVDGGGPANGWYTSKPTGFTLSAANGVKTVYVWVADVYGQVNLHPSPASIFLDTIPPGTPVVTLSDVASGSLTDTSDADVNFSVSNDGDASYWCIIAQMAAAPAPTAPTRGSSCWVSGKPTLVQLSNLGLNQVYVWTKDLAGNISASPGTQYINWTTLTINDPAFTLSDTLTSLQTYTRNAVVNLGITNDSGAVKWCVSETQISRPPLSTSVCAGGTGPLNGWTSTRPTNFTLSGGDGSKTVYVWVANPLLNTNANPITRTIVLDTIAPAIPVVDLTDPNTHQANFTNQSTVDLSIASDTDAVNWCIFEKSTVATPPSLPAYNDACWVSVRPTQVTLGATGGRRIYLYTKDIAQNVSPAPAVAQITYTTVAPSNPIGVLRDQETNSATLAKTQLVNLSINSPAGTVRWCVSETQNTQPATGTATCNGGAGPSSGWFTSTPSTYSLSGGDGLKTVYLWVADGANNVNSTTATTTITLDMTAPPIPTAVISDPNSNSTTKTNQIIPKLTVTGDTDAVRWCRLIQDPSAAAPAKPSLTDICWVVTRPTNVVLDQTGERMLYLFTRDAAGNVSNAETATIEYTTDAPTDPTVILADSGTALTNYARGTSVSVSITNDLDAAKWCVSETQNTRPSLGTATCAGGLGGSAGWSLSKPTTWTLSATNGLKRLYVWTANAANTVNNNPSTASITLDQTAPSTPTVALADPNTSSSANTNQSTITLAISGEDADVTAWCVLEQAAASAAPSTPLFNNACWSTSKPVTATLGATGSRKVYVYFRDHAYNVSAAGSQTISYSTTAPATPTLAVTDPSTASTSYLRQSASTIAITGDTGAVKWCVSETQTLKPSLGTTACAGGTGPASGWFATRPTSFTFSVGDGAKTLYVWTADVSNNVSAVAATATIGLDTLPPSVPFVTISDLLTSSTTVTNATPATLTIQYDTDAVKWCVIEQSFATAVPSQPAWNAGCWVGSRPTSISFGGTGIRRAFVYTQDVARNVTPAAAVAQINYTTTPPSDPTLSFTNSSTGSTTITKDLTVTPSIYSPTGTVAWCLSETQSTRPANGLAACAGGAGSANGWSTSLPSSFTLSSGDGAKTVYIWVADTSNNVNANATTGTITLDTVVPATPTVALSDPNTGSTTKTNQFSVDLSITADTDAVKWCPIIQAAAAAAPSTPALNDSCWRNSRPSTQLIDATGSRKLYVFTRDSASNVGTAGVTTIDYSILPPADATIALADATTGLTDYARGVSLSIAITGDTGAVQWCVSESQSTKPSLGTSACNGGAGPSNGWYTARPTTFTLSGTEALKRVYVWTSDLYNNVNSNATSNTITLDTTAPIVPSVAMQDPNTASATQTNQSTVNLNIGATADGLAWCVIEQAAAAAAPSAPLYNNACFTTTKPATQALGALGSRKVYVYTRDRASNVSTSAGAATINYSTTAPATATIAVTDPTTGSSSYLRQVASTIAITGDAGAVKWCVSESQTSRPSLGTSACTGGQGSSNGWFTARPTSFTATSGDASKTLYLWTADVANNTSSSSATVSITLDTLAPAIPNVALADTNTANTAFTNNSTANISITSDTDAAKWCVFEQASTDAAPSAPLYNNGCWVGSRPATQTLGATGTRRVYVYTQDTAGNVSLAPSLASINYSTSAPSDPVLVLSNTVTGSRTYTNDRTVSVSINNPIGAVQWCISETQTVRPANGTATCNGGAGPANGWYTNMPSTLQLSTGDALKTVYIWVSDSSNNTNANSSSTSITLLQTAPVAPTVALADPNTSSNSTTNQSSVTLSISNDTGAIAWCPIAQDAASAAPSAPDASNTCWVLTRPASIALGATGSRKVYVFLRDAAQNVSNPGSATILLSTASPADPTLAMTHATTGLSTYAKTTALNIVIGNDAAATRWCVSETQSVKPPLGTSTCTGGAGGSAGWYTARPTTFTLTGGDATKRVYVWVANSANNVNDNPISQTIVLDTAAPSSFTVTGTTGGGDTLADAFLGTTNVPTVNWNAASGATSYSVVVKDNADSAVVCAAQNTVATSYTFAGCTLTDATHYKISVTAYDDAQNTTTASNNAFDFVVKLTPPGTFTISGMTGGSDTTADQWAGSSLPTVTWTASTGANSYQVRILANDGVTVMCPMQTKASGVLSHDYSTTGCSALVDNTLYSAEVTAFDIAGNQISATNSLFSFRTDLSAPTVNITANPAAQAITGNANFTFSTDDTISGMAGQQCKLDSGSFVACATATSHTYSGLADGSHTFTVKAIDKVGLTQTASYTWSIDTVVPNTFTITGATGATDAVIDNQLRNDTIMTANWNTSANATSYEVSILNGDDSVACAPVTKAAGSTSHTFTGCTLANPGTYKIKVVAFRGYGTSYAPTPLTIAASLDSLTATITSSSGTVASGSSVTLTMVTYQNSVQMNTNVINPTFSIAAGGTSTGTFGAVSYIGSGTYQVTFTGVTAGTASNITASTSYLAGFTSVTPASVTVNPGGVSASVSNITLSKSIIKTDNTDLTVVTVKVRDAANNPITGATIVGSLTGGTSTGVFSAWSESPAGSGNYQANLAGRVAQGAVSVSASANGTTIASPPSLFVQPGPPIKVGVTGPTALTAHNCVGPYTATLLDYWNNASGALSNVTLNMSGLTLGNYSMAADCSSTVTSAQILLGVSFATGIYVMPRAPATNNLTFTDAAANLTAGSLNVTISSALAWLGTSGQLAWGSTTGYPTRSTFDGMVNPRGQWFNPVTNKLYVADTGNHRINRYDGTTQNLTGWIGRTDSIDNINCPGYTNPSSGAATPAWCTGGSPQASGGTNLDNMFSSPSDIVGDGTYLYILDAGNFRIAKVEESTGLFKGWIGRVSNNTGMSCASGSATNATGTPDWCTGGVSSSSTGTNWDMMFNVSTNSAVRYVADPASGTNLLIIIDSGLHRISRVRVTNSNAYWEGWAGRYNAGTLTDGYNTTGCAGKSSGDATPGWCKGGTSQASPAPAVPTLPNYDNMFNGLRGLTLLPGNPTLAYFGDNTNGRWIRFNVHTGTTDAWAGRASYQYPATGGTNCGNYNADTGWCTGGVPIYNGYSCPTATCGAGNTGSRATYPTNTISMDTDGTYLYHVFAFSNNYGISRVPIGTGLIGSASWYYVGRISSAPTLGTGCSTTPLGFAAPNWCAGGNTTTGINEGHFQTAISIFLDTTNDRIFTTDYATSKVQMHTLSTGVPLGWIGAKANQTPTNWLTTYSPGLLANVGIKNDDASYNMATGIVAEGANLFVADTGNNRIKKFSSATGLYLGWYGKTSALPYGEDDSCTNITGGALTPTWCFGGSSQAASVSGTGELNTPRGLAADSTYLYIVDTAQHRIVRIKRNEGSFAGWLGWTSAGTSAGTLTGTDTLSNSQCSGVGGSSFTGAFCAAGAHLNTNTANGGFNSPRGAAIDPVNGYLYVADTSANRVGMYTTKNVGSDPAGTFLGWLGRPNAIPGTAGPTSAQADTACSTLTASIPTKNWCIGGSSQGGNIAAQNFGGFTTPYGIAYDGGAIYVADTGNHKIHKFNSTTGTYLGWIGRTATSLPLSAGAGSGLANTTCTGMTLANATQGWCNGGGSQASGGAVYDNAFNSPTGIWADPNSAYFYVVDSGNHRVTKHRKDNGAFVGWRGGVATNPDGGDVAACSATGVNNPTPGWCTGGTSQSSRALGGFYQPHAITGDANFLYVTDQQNNRVVAIPK